MPVLRQERSSDSKGIRAVETCDFKETGNIFFIQGFSDHTHREFNVIFTGAGVPRHAPKARECEPLEPAFQGNPGPGAS